MILRNWKTLVSGAAVLSVIVASDTTAQFGSLSGRVVDIRGDPVGGANVWVSDTHCIGMTDERGGFSLPIVPSGTLTVNVWATGYGPVKTQQIVANPNNDSKIDFQLKAAHQVADDRISWWRPTGETPAREVISTEAQNDSILDAIALKAGVVTNEMPDQDRIHPVQRWGIEFNVRYSFDIHDDSTIVRIVANGTNVSAQTRSFCGVFAFVQSPHEQTFDGLLRNHPSPQLECRTMELLPGDSHSDSLIFSYLTSEFRDQPKSVGLWCWFFLGKDGSPWEETDFVDLGVLDIRLGEPSN